MTTKKLFNMDAEQVKTHLERNLNMDASVSTFFLRELEEIDGQMYDVKYAKLEALELVSAKSLSAATEMYTYRQFDARGIAKMTSNYANGSPRVDVEGKEYSSRVKSGRASYGYNMQELRASQQEGRNIDGMKAVMARRAINELTNKAALLGDAEHGLVGLFNQPNAQTYTVPADGTGASALWSAKTADLILRDMFGIVDQIPTVTKEVEQADRLLLPYGHLRLISSKRLGSVNDTTVLEFFKMQRPSIEVRGALFLDTAGSGATARMVAYDSKRENVEFLLPIAFEQFAPQLQGMEYVVECHARLGGVVLRYPLTMAYGDGI